MDPLKIFVSVRNRNWPKIKKNPVRTGIIFLLFCWSDFLQTRWKTQCWTSNIWGVLGQFTLICDKRWQRTWQWTSAHTHEPSLSSIFCHLPEVWKCYFIYWSIKVTVSATCNSFSAVLQCCDMVQATSWSDRSSFLFSFLYRASCFNVYNAPGVSFCQVWFIRTATVLFWHAQNWIYIFRKAC